MTHTDIDIHRRPGDLNRRRSKAAVRFRPYDLDSIDTAPQALGQVFSYDLPNPHGRESSGAVRRAASRRQIHFQNAASDSIPRGNTAPSSQDVHEAVPCLDSDRDRSEGRLHSPAGHGQIFRQEQPHRKPARDKARIRVQLPHHLVSSLLACPQGPENNRRHGGSANHLSFGLREDLTEKPLILPPGSRTVYRQVDHVISDEWQNRTPPSVSAVG